MSAPVYNRKLRTGEVLRCEACEVYIPRRGYGRAARHYADGFSSGLWTAKKLPEVGRVWAYDLARALADLVPDCDVVCNPPPSRANRGWHLARALAEAVVSILQTRGGEVRLGRELRWADGHHEASKVIVHQGGKGRGLGREIILDEDLSGQRVAIVDDLVTSGATGACVAEALVGGGAEVVGLYCLGATERTELRPEPERDRIKQRAEIGSLRRKAREGQPQRGGDAGENQNQIGNEE